MSSAGTASTATSSLVLSDHNYLTPTTGLNAVHGAPDKFIVIPGEEITMTVATKPVHVNGVAIASYVAPPSAPDDVVDAMQWSVDGIRRMGGVPHVNHPNFGWAVTVDELARVERLNLFEIYNGHPQVNNVGGGGVPGWRSVGPLLTGGRLLYGVAVDDAHHFKRPGDPTCVRPGTRLGLRAGRGARAADDLRGARSRRLLRLDRRRARPTTRPMRRASRSRSTRPPEQVSRAVHRPAGPRAVGGRRGTASYAFKGDEGYVRVKVLESNGLMAWTQPVAVGVSGPKQSKQ